MEIRKATPSDINIGKEFIIIGDDNELFVLTVCDVINSSNEYKAFIAQDGCRYGLCDLRKVSDFK